MPRAAPPAQLDLPAIPKPFKLSDDAHKEIAEALGLPKLPPLMATNLEYNIGNYKTNTRHKVKATLGRTIAAIDKALIAADAFEKALMPFTCPQRSRLGQGTYHALAPVATPLLGYLRTYRHKAKAQREKLGEHPPLPKNPQLVILCLWLRAIYEAVQEAREAAMDEKGLLTFARTVLGRPISPARISKIITFIRIA
jgi:hypothetical protein